MHGCMKIIFYVLFDSGCKKLHVTYGSAVCNCTANNYNCSELKEALCTNNTTSVGTLLLDIDCSNTCTTKPIPPTRSSSSYEAELLRMYVVSGVLGFTSILLLALVMMCGCVLLFMKRRATKHLSTRYVS